MTHHIAAVRGRMTPQKLDAEGNVVEESEFVADELEVAFEHESGLIGIGKAASEQEALRLAKADAEERLAERTRKTEERKRREAEDPMVRLARLEAIAREQGWEL